MIESSHGLLGLLHTVRLVRSRIASDADYIAGHETRTRQFLIDPVLTALGWSVLDPKLVILEATAQTGWADYALQPQTDVALVVEAKRLGSNLDGYPIEQAARYGRWFGCRRAVVTDGDSWHLFSVGGLMLESPTTLMRVKISVNDDESAAVRLSELSRQTQMQDVVNAPA